MLRPPHPERRLAHRPPPRNSPSAAAAKSGTEPASAAATPAAESDPPLSPAQKEALFRDFDRYLERSGRSR